MWMWLWGYVDVVVWLCGCGYVDVVVWEGWVYNRTYAEIKL